MVNLLRIVQKILPHFGQHLLNVTKFFLFVIFLKLGKFWNSIQKMKTYSLIEIIILHICIYNIHILKKIHTFIFLNNFFLLRLEKLCFTEFRNWVILSMWIPRIIYIFRTFFPFFFSKKSDFIKYWDYWLYKKYFSDWMCKNICFDSW